MLCFLVIVFTCIVAVTVAHPAALESRKGFVLPEPPKYGADAAKSEFNATLSCDCALTCPSTTPPILHDLGLKRNTSSFGVTSGQPTCYTDDFGRYPLPELHASPEPPSQKRAGSLLWTSRTCHPRHTLPDNELLVCPRI